MENLCCPLCTFKDKKIIMSECWREPPIHVLSASCLNVENWTKDEVMWWRGNWTNRNKKLVLAIMEKCYGKSSYSKISQLLNSKVWVSTSLSVDGNGTLALAIMKKWKDGSHVVENCHIAKFPITNPLKFGSPLLWVSMEMKNWCQLLQKNGTMDAMSWKIIIQQNF